MTDHEQTQAPDFSRQIELLRKLEPPHQPAFLLQIILVLVGCMSAWLLAGWWVCAVWSVFHVTLQFGEKLVVRMVPARPSQAQYALVLIVLALQGSIYCFMPLYFWFMGPDLAKFGAVALITASTMHTMLHRATYPSILLCFLVPNAGVFAIISVSAFASSAGSAEAPLYLVGGIAICTFFLSMFFQVYLKEAQALRAVEDRRGAEAAKVASEIRFKSLFESAPIPIREEDLSGMKRLIDDLGITDPDAFEAYLHEHPEFIKSCRDAIILLDANRASLDQYGFKTKSKMLAHKPGALSSTDLVAVRGAALVLHSGGTGHAFETVVNRPDGDTRTVAARWSVIPGHEDTYSRILICSVDMTEHRKSEEALRHAQKMEAVGKLTGGVAHDFNNLLTVIGGNLDLLEVSAEYDPDLATPIRKAVNRGAELTQKLLAFSRKQPLRPQPVNVGTLVGEISDMISRTLGDEIRVTIDIDPNLWPAMADPGQVEASLLNLSINSRDAMPGGGTLTISSRNVQVKAGENLDLNPGDYIVLSVSDTGMGMTPDLLSRAYEPFFTTKEVGKGSGLGLPSVYGFAKQSGGDVRIQSVPGEGTTVSLYLPRSRSEETEDRQMSPRFSPFDGQGKTVLVLEDDPEVSRYLARLMDLYGFSVITAANVAAARAIVQRGAQIDMLISDVMLPGGIRGPEFAADLARDHPHIGIVLISGRPTEADLGSFPNLRSVSLLQKPFAQDELLQAVKDALHHENVS